VDCFLLQTCFYLFLELLHSALIRAGLIEVGWKLVEAGMILVLFLYLK